MVEQSDLVDAVRLRAALRHFSLGGADLPRSKLLVLDLYRGANDSCVVLMRKLLQLDCANRIAQLAALGKHLPSNA